MLNFLNNFVVFFPFFFLNYDTMEIILTCSLCAHLCLRLQELS